MKRLTINRARELGKDMNSCESATMSESDAGVCPMCKHPVYDGIKHDCAAWSRRVNGGEPYNGTPFGWAFRTGSGCWYWSMGTVGLEREDAADRARQYARDGYGPAQVAKVWIDVPPDGSPIDALAIIERAEEMYGDNIPEVIVPEEGPIICCDKDDVEELQAGLDAVWHAWIAKHGTKAVFVADDGAEDA